jgi:hypothetical protein
MWRPQHGGAVGRRGSGRREDGRRGATGTGEERGGGYNIAGRQDRVGRGGSGSYNMAGRQGGGGREGEGQRANKAADEY